MVTSSHCYAKFGDPNNQSWMIVWDIPTYLEKGVIPHKIYCNKLMVEPLEKALDNLIERQFINELKTWDGCFNIRKKVSNDSWSLHSWGIAVDINAKENGYGKKPKLTEGFVKCFTDAGFEWGGNWEIKDGMHFQLKEI